MAAATISNELSPPGIYRTWNQTYGTNWQTGRPFLLSFTQSSPYRQLQDRRQVLTYNLPKDRSAIALSHNPESPCGIMTMSNVSATNKGNFSNVRRDLHSDRQGLWNNALFNTQGATIDRGVATYSNLQASIGLTVGYIYI